MAAKKKIKNLDELVEELLDMNESIREDLLKEGNYDITDFEEVDVDDVSDWISTGSFILDCHITNSHVLPSGELALGIAGGKIATISGVSSSGKSILAAHILKSAQQKNAFCAYIDGEQAVMKSFYKNVGVDFSKSKLTYSESNIAERNFELIEKVVEKIGASKHPNRLGLIVWDSIASTTTLEELKEKYGDASYGHLAKQMSRGFRKIIRKLRKYNIALVFTNQLRKNMKAKTQYDDPYIEPGGEAPRFYSSVAIRLLPPTKSNRIINSKGQQVGQKVKVRISKNRYGPPQPDLEFSLYFGRGIDDDANIYNWLLDHKYIKKWGEKSTLMIPNKGEIKFETSNWKRMLADDPQLLIELKKIISDEIRIDLYNDDFYDETIDDDYESLSEELDVDDSNGESDIN